jgi:hypothetical protein
MKADLKKPALLRRSGFFIPLMPGVILDFNRKSSDHIESFSPLFVGAIRIPFSEDPFLKPPIDSRP